MNFKQLMNNVKRLAAQANDTYWSKCNALEEKLCPGGVDAKLDVLVDDGVPKVKAMALGSMSKAKLIAISTAWKVEDTTCTAVARIRKSN